MNDKRATMEDQLTIMVYGAFFFFLGAKWLCGVFIVDAPLLLTLASAACTIPFWIVVFSAKLPPNLPKSKLLWGLGFLSKCYVFGLAAMMFAAEIYRSAGTEISRQEPNANAQLLLDAWTHQAAMLSQLAMYGFVVGLAMVGIMLIAAPILLTRRARPLVEGNQA
ncbi:hypothetical protein PbB2_01646 [Candidatus Phycosocius bacilliformis]|uniref:Uncharacterized protein n=1 Tax=Candidatus Phycosocius bacilliformis TaxID=1445552 RepID=A0A2P2EA81_9PROT|nr:hypothetical protein [Candidatus Phycosocius bacilliformis]GBF57975.1 hypothetical protein PbB2_01646 [Candidatus Phycosocius bacilliformis]